MEYLYPDYYKQFHCIASECEDTCCAGWQIAIDEDSLKKYQKTKGPFGNRLKNCINWKEKVFEQSEKRCAFLNEENLCDLYAELGPDSLCQTCRRYPRHREEFENLREMMLSLSCPEACRLILTQKGSVKFVHREWDTGYEEYETFDFFFFTKLEDARKFLHEILEADSMDLSMKMAMMLVFAHDFQRRIMKERIYDIDMLIEGYKNPAMPTPLLSKFHRYIGNYSEKIRWLQLVVGEYKTLEPLDAAWFSYLDESIDTLAHLGEVGYQKEKQKFYDSYPSMEHELEQVLITLLYTYFCGAVYDYDALTKMKFILMGALMIRELAFAWWLEHGKEFRLEDQVFLVHKYSREIEHSDINLERFAKKLKKLPLFHYENILMAIFS